MRPPADLPSILVALGEAFARRAGIAPADFWAYVYRKKAPPAALRAAIVEALFPAVSPADFVSEGLTSQESLSTLDTMTATNLSSNALRSRGRMSEAVRDHRATRHLARKGVTFAEVSAVLEERLGRKVPRSTVQAWHRPKSDPNARGIPEDAADVYREEWGVPRSAWSRIIPKP